MLKEDLTDERKSSPHMVGWPCNGSHNHGVPSNTLGNTGLFSHLVISDLFSSLALDWALHRMHISLTDCLQKCPPTPKCFLFWLHKRKCNTIHKEKTQNHFNYFSLQITAGVCSQKMKLPCKRKNKKTFISLPSFIIWEKTVELYLKLTEFCVHEIYEGACRLLQVAHQWCYTSLLLPFCISFVKFIRTVGTLLTAEMQIWFAISAIQSKCFSSEL